MGNIGKISKITGLGQAVGAINKLIDAVARLTPIESPSVKPSYLANGVSYRIIDRPKRSGTSIPESFGIKDISGNEVTIYGGKIWIGKTVYEVSDTTLTITSDSVIGWSFSFSSGALSIVNFGSSFTADDDTIGKPLYYFVYNTSNGTASLEERLTKCEVFPANFGSY